MTAAARVRLAAVAAAVAAIGVATGVGLAHRSAAAPVSDEGRVAGTAPRLESSAVGRSPRASDDGQPGRAAEVPGGLIVFVSERDGQREIYAVRPDGSGLERATGSARQHYAGPASPDRQTLLAVTTEDGAAGAHRESVALLVPGVPSWSERVIAGPSHRVRNPSWLPDGSGVVLESDAAGFVALELHRLDGRPPERLTAEPSGSFDPAVSPLGSAVAFASSREGDAEIFRLDIEPRALTRLTWSPGDDGAPVWSPDGATIAYLSQRRGALHAYVMDATGAHPRPLLGPNGPSSEPEAPFRAHAQLAFSPDGSRVVLVEQRAERSGLRVVRVADGLVLAATDGAWRDETPCWSPDGRHIVFASDRSGDVELYLMTERGQDLHQLTRTPGADWLPRWLAAPRLEGLPAPELRAPEIDEAPSG